MSGAETIRALCQVVELQSRVIRAQAEALEQYGLICAEEERAQAEQLAQAYLGETWSERGPGGDAE